jgi:hypothetical protein
MGLYTIDCPVCRQTHQWFSGSMDQRCERCKADKRPHWEATATRLGDLLALAERVIEDAISRFKSSQDNLTAASFEKRLTWIREQKINE